MPERACLDYHRASLHQQIRRVLSSEIVEEQAGRSLGPHVLNCASLQCAAHMQDIFKLVKHYRLYDKLGGFLLLF